MVGVVERNAGSFRNKWKGKCVVWWVVRWSVSTKREHGRQKWGWSNKGGWGERGWGFVVVKTRRHTHTYIYLPCRKTTAGWICDICHLFPVYLLYLSASIQWNHRIPLEHYAVSIYSRMAAPFFTNENWITSINKRHSTGAHRPRQDTDIASIMMDVIICILYIGMYKYITLYCM